jgi:AhpD family alkylhydroperoxidase
MSRDSEFFERRARGNDAILRDVPRAIRRFLAIDREVYEDGALTKRTKELLGLVASTVLRCDDCIAHHIDQAVECGVSRDEIVEALGIALVVGGSITIPHLREAVSFLDELEAGPTDR